MTAELAARAGGPAECAGVEVEYVDPDRGRERRTLAAWSARFERVGPVRCFASFRGQRNWPGWWWFSRTGEHLGYESWVERDVLMALDADPAWRRSRPSRCGCTGSASPGRPGVM